MLGPHPWSRNSPVPPLVWDWVPLAPLGLFLSPVSTVQERQCQAVPGGVGRAGCQREAWACPSLRRQWQWLTGCQGAGGALTSSRGFCPCPLPAWEMLGSSGGVGGGRQSHTPWDAPRP